MANTIDFPQKLHSTRRDHKLVDATEIDGVIPTENLLIAETVQHNSHAISLIQEAIRDLVVNNAAGWQLATDAAIDYVVDDDYSTASFAGNELNEPDDGWSDDFAPDGKGFVFVRLPEGADPSHYRMEYRTESDAVGDGTHIAGNLWLRQAESTEDSTHDYYLVPGHYTPEENWGQFVSIVSINVQHDAHTLTSYKGTVTGTLADGIVDMDALDASLRALLQGSNIVSGALHPITTDGQSLLEGRYNVATGTNDISVSTPTPSARNKYILVYNVPTGGSVTVRTNNAAPLTLIVLGPGEAIWLRSTGAVAGAWHPVASHTPNRGGALIQNVFDGTTGTSTSEQEVTGVTIENLANVAYSIRVGGASEFTLGSALRGVRSSDPLQVGNANFYTKANDDNLYRTLDSASDGTLEIWRVNDLAALRAALAASGNDSETFTAALKAKLERLNIAVIAPMEPLDGEGLETGDVVISDHALHEFATPGTANAFAGVLGTYREGQTYYLVTSRSDSHFGAHGRFIDNHDAAIGAVLVGQGTNNVMEVQIDKTVYETAKGSALANSDEISAAFTGTVSGSETTTTHTLPYVRSFTIGDKTWLSFEGQAPNSVPKRIGTSAEGWSLIVSQGGSVLLTHGIDASHFVEYPVNGIDQVARDAADAHSRPAAIRDSLQTLAGDDRLAASAVKDLPVQGFAGLRTESISFQDIPSGTNNAASDVEIAPVGTDPIEVEHGEGDPEIITGLQGNDFTVAPGLYLLSITGDYNGNQVGTFDFDLRESSADVIEFQFPERTFYNSTQPVNFTITTYWHNQEAQEVNLFLERHTRAVEFENLKLNLSRLTTEDSIEHHVIDPLEPLDTAEAHNDQVVLSEHEFYVRQPGHGTANTFAGILERWTDDADTWLGTAIRNSVYGQRGQFSSNPDSNVGVLLAGVSTDNADTIDLWIRKVAYDAAIGRAAQSGDTVKAVITGTVNGSAMTVTSTLTYAVFHGDSGYYSFSAVDSANVLRRLADGAAWSMVVNRSNDSVLLAHDAGTPHFVEYPIRSAIDQYARDEVARALSEITLSFEQSRYPRDETFIIPEVGTNGVSEHDPLILAARGDVLIGHYFGDSDHFGRSEDLNLGIEGVATEDAASGSVKMLAWGLVTSLPMGPQYTHAELQTATNAPPGKPVYVTDRNSRVRPGGSTDNRNSGADLTYWTLDPDESADDEIYGYCVGWEGATGTNQQGVYSVIFDFRRVPFPASS